MPYLIFPLSLLLLITAVFPVAANGNPDALIRQAREMALPAHPYWHKLLHYHRNKLGAGVTSQADDARFFLAPDGKTQPQAELEATLRAFFATSADTPAQCRFPARYHWLKQQLDPQGTSLPQRDCPELQQWLAALDPGRLTLVFPSAYINNPSTMFGHTFLRVDKPADRRGSVLTSAAINFAAEKTEFSGLLFAIESLTGGQAGYFSIQPYYEKVNDYSDLESRDIWEYDLNFTPAEIRRMLLHLWELREIRFDYYFLDENCSYQLLALLDSARPGLDLTSRFPYDAIPIDTARAILELPGILADVHYRPSARTRLAWQLEQMTPAERQLVRDLAWGRIAVDDSRLNALDDTDKARVLSSAYDYVQFKYRRRKIEREDSAARSLQLLSARSALPAAAPLSPPMPAVRPDQGHPSARLIYGLGAAQDSSFLDLTWRPAYHDLLDSDDGHVAGAQINFLDTRLRFDERSNRIRIQQFTLIDIYSVTPHTQDFEALSWKFNTGLERLPLGYSNRQQLPYTVNGGAGRTWALGGELRFFALLEGTLMLHGDIDNYAALGAGPGLGLLWKAAPAWKLWLNARLQRYGVNLHMSYLEYSLQQSFTLARDIALRLNLERSGADGNLHNELSLNLHVYY